MTPTRRSFLGGFAAAAAAGLVGREALPAEVERAKFTFQGSPLSREIAPRSIVLAECRPVGKDLEYTVWWTDAEGGLRIASLRGSDNLKPEVDRKGNLVMVEG